MTYDVFEIRFVDYVARDITAKAVTNYLQALTEQRVIDGVAANGYVDANGYRAIPHGATP
jgi:hypothetical protein